MCIQCFVSAVNVLGNEKEFLPGWFLMKSTKEYESSPEKWPLGFFALLRCNEPDFVFPFKYEDYYDIFFERPDIFEKYMFGDLQTCYDLVKACEMAGWNKEEDGDAVYWIAERILGVLKQSDGLAQLENEHLHES